MIPLGTVTDINNYMHKNVYWKIDTFLTIGSPLQVLSKSGSKIIFYLVDVFKYRKIVEIVFISS